MSDEMVSINTKTLDALIASFEGKTPVVKVGILGSKSNRFEVYYGPVNPRKDPINDKQKPISSPPTNAEVGAAHEFGTDKLPRRSFLRVPLADNLQKYLKEAGAFGEDTLLEIVQNKGFTNFMKMVGTVCERIVADAFHTGGFGKWKPSNMKGKKVQQTLVETQQLRNSISSEVV